MSANTALLLLRLEGALQSWGEDAKWDFRDSASMPSKSGVIGLLSCALGYERSDPRIAKLSEDLTMGIRADRQGTAFTDYQTVTGDPLRNAEGKKRSLGNTFISRRVYLQDASFLVALAGERELLDRLADALRSPCWCLYLGRKSCVPSRPVLEKLTDEYESIADALHRYPAPARAHFPMTIEVEEECPSASSVMRTDVRLNGERSFARRRVWRDTIQEVQDGSD